MSILLCFDVEGEGALRVRGGFALNAEGEERAKGVDFGQLINYYYKIYLYIYIIYIYIYYIYILRWRWR